MRVKNMAWTFDKAFSKETCDKIIEHGLAQKSMKAKTGTGNVSINRDSEITWLYVSGTNSECDKYVTYNPQGDWWSFGDAIWTTWEDKKMFDTILTTGSGFCFKSFISGGTK